jgi:phosphoribosylformylglycinamidine cyclo-ligase
VFEWLQEVGGVPEADMRRTFNLGIGMVLIVEPDRVQDVLAMLTAGGESAFQIGVLKAA